ncbi:MAG: hypothetical protein KatS3mg008_1295 [Acidimicrobiales bacterium]|nr:MAG: hypothetical protein KatS3mg008_1295 [Acidimicrobiales bacterium]
MAARPPRRNDRGSEGTGRGDGSGSDSGNPALDGGEVLTHIYFLLDRSGSMEAIREDVIGGFNSFLEDQIAEGPDALMTLVQFDTVDPFEVVADAVPITEMVRLDHTNFVPRGGTPLLDSFGKMITKAMSRSKQLEDEGLPPEQVVMVVYTDGLENSSTEWKRSQLKELISKCETERGWLFAYLGADPDSFSEAESIGFAPGSAAHFAPTADGVARSMSALSLSISQARGDLRRGRRVDSLFGTRNLDLEGEGEEAQEEEE